MNVEARLKKIEQAINPDVSRSMVLEFWCLERMDRKTFETEGIGELFDRYQEAQAKEPQRNIDLIEEIFTVQEEKAIMKLFNKQQKKR
jgi:hypothetical protein